MPDIKKAFNPKKGCKQNANDKIDMQCTILKSNKFSIMLEEFPRDKWNLGILMPFFRYRYQIMLLDMG